MAQLPEFNEAGDLPVGVYHAPLSEIVERFGRGTPRRQVIAERLRRFHTLAQQTGRVGRFIIFGSFVTAAPPPNDVDVFLLMDDALWTMRST